MTETTTPREVGVTELVLRDAHQSLMATRMALEDMVDACADIDAAGYWSVECWGGATYDACIRFLNEDPWERLRTFRELMPNSRLQMLLRGQNLLGYRHYEDGVVNRFVEKSAENGMDVYRVFDALNDVRNVRRAIEAVKRVALVAERTTPVRLRFSEGQLAIEAGTGEDAQASEALEASVSGPDITVAFNPGYLLDGLGALGTEWTRMSFTGPLKAAMITGQTSQDGELDTTYRYVLQPVRLAG